MASDGYPESSTARASTDTDNSVRADPHEERNLGTPDSGKGPRDQEYGRSPGEVVRDFCLGIRRKRRTESGGANDLGVDSSSEPHVEDACIGLRIIIQKRNMQHEPQRNARNSADRPHARQNRAPDDADQGGDRAAAPPLAGEFLAAAARAHRTLTNEFDNHVNRTNQLVARAIFDTEIRHKAWETVRKSKETVATFVDFALGKEADDDEDND